MTRDPMSHWGQKLKKNSQGCRILIVMSYKSVIETGNEIEKVILANNFAQTSVFAQFRANLCFRKLSA
jgi:hypothetical protein